MKKIWLWIGGLIGLALLAGLAFPSITVNCGVSGGSAMTCNIINQLNVALTAYKIEYGHFPSSSENFRLVPILKEDNPRKIVFMEFHPKALNLNQEIIDAWGTPLRFTFTGSDILIESAGKDQIFGTKDDLNNKK